MRIVPGGTWVKPGPVSGIPMRSQSLMLWKLSSRLLQPLLMALMQSASRSRTTALKTFFGAKCCSFCLSSSAERGAACAAPRGCYSVRSLTISAFHSDSRSPSSESPWTRRLVAR